MRADAPRGMARAVPVVLGTVLVSKEGNGPTFTFQANEVRVVTAGVSHAYMTTEVNNAKRIIFMTLEQVGDTIVVTTASSGSGFYVRFKPNETMYAWSGTFLLRTLIDNSDGDQICLGIESAMVNTDKCYATGKPDVLAKNVLSFSNQDVFRGNLYSTKGNQALINNMKENVKSQPLNQLDGLIASNDLTWQQTQWMLVYPQAKNYVQLESLASRSSCSNCKFLSMKPLKLGTIGNHAALSNPTDTKTFLTLTPL